MARSELFPENTLVPVVPFLERRDSDTFEKLIRLWVLLLAGNLVGAVIFAWALARTPMVKPALHSTLTHLASEAVSGGFGHVLYTGIYAGWLIALLAWLLASTRPQVPSSLSSGSAPRQSMRSASSTRSQARSRRSTCRGVLLVALLNYGQVAAERSGGNEEADKAARR